MVWILMSIIATAVLSVLMVRCGENGDSGWHFTLAIVGVFGGCASLLALVCYSFTVWKWIASEHQTNIINREYDTSYTREEVFYASDVIETVRQLNRNRIEVNGDILRDKSVKK